ncbi:MAG: type II toxin-antitoxin system ParD family antitoxin [Magnetococcales bacterium]|nr:type II toxin-antitoxin system ParD family antitoxin [Magnetococcales bacterium]
MNISLPPALEKFVKDRVKEGRYSSASEVIREGLRLLIDQEEGRAERFASIQETEQQIETDESEKSDAVPMADVFRGMDHMKAYAKNNLK